MNSNRKGGKGGKGMKIIPDGPPMVRLSGPVGMYYLRPAEDRPELPIVVLLSDVHTDLDAEKMCEVCTEDPECRQVFDAGWLNELDRLAEAIPVDFFTESSELLIREAPKLAPDYVMFGKFLSTVGGCYGRSETCPTRNIRWHHTDLRNWPGEVESQIELVANTVWILGRQLGDVGKIDSLHQAMARSPHSTQFVTTFLEDLAALWLKRKKTSIHQAIVDLVDYVWGVLRNENSRLLKQLRKLSEENEVDDWQVVLTRYMVDKIANSLSNRLDLSEPLPRGAVVFLTELASNPDMEWTPRMVAPDTSYLLILLKMMLQNLTSQLLDLYAIARMLKLPHQNDRAVVAFGYFGVAHTENITHTLVELFGYELVAEYGSERGNCVVISAPIDLYGDATSLAAHRYSIYPQLLQTYLLSRQPSSSFGRRRGPAVKGTGKTKKLGKDRRK